MKRLGLMVLAFAGMGSAASAQILKYSNFTNFANTVQLNGTAAGGITPLVADDITLDGGAGHSVTRFDFSVANLNTVALSVRPRVRFYQDNGAGGNPGTLIVGFSFNPITINAGTVSTFFATIAVGTFVVPANNKFWAGMTFDNVGATATEAQLANFGQGVWFGPPSPGSSTNNIFITSAPGSHLANNPLGVQSALQVNGQDANLGWAFQTVPEPTSIAVLGLGAAALLRRRRK